MAEQGPKPYVKLASTLVLIGMGLFTLERYGLTQFKATHPGGLILSAMVLIPLVLILSGAVVFMVGRMRRL